jgi:predicted dehydrogenase
VCRCSARSPALSLAEFDTIPAVCARTAVAFGAVFQHRFGGGGLALARLVAAGSLGPAHTAVCHTLWHRPDEYFAVPWRGHWDTEGGGPTMGHGIHQMDLLLAVLGPWREVAARQAHPTATEGLSCAIVTFDNGAVATVVNSMPSPRETTYLRFDFAAATVELTHLYGYGDANWAVTAAPGDEDWVARLWAAEQTGVASGHSAQFAHVLDALGAGRPLPVSVADVRPTMEVVAAIYASPSPERPCGGARSGPVRRFTNGWTGLERPGRLTPRWYGRVRPARRRLRWPRRAPPRRQPPRPRHDALRRRRRPDRPLW